MLDSVEPSEASKIPSFFARMVADDFASGGRRTKSFIGDLKSLLAGAAFINGDFTIEESNALSAELKKMMMYSISQGVKVDYSTGRIRERITPLKEDSYVSPETQAAVGAELIFEALNRDFLRPGGKANGGYGRSGASGADGPDGSGAGDAGSGRDGGGDAEGDETERTTNEAQQIKSQVEIKEDTRTMEELLEELDALVGLTSIKEDIRSLMNFITITKLRQERGLNVPAISYHLVFTGNPGTGKTTVARLVAGLYHRIGILPKGQLVEADRSQLVAGYTGQTALKTMDVINQAMGGVLFIDEAYALVNDDQDSFGKEAIETILKAMEDHRDELVVIVAGYTELMHKFIESNPGFRSRFSKYFEFPDYTGDQLLEIFKTFCAKNGYHLTEEAETYLLLQFNEMYEHRDSHFGNGRTARNVFEKAIHQQANRLAGVVDPSEDAKAGGAGDADGAAAESDSAVDAVGDADGAAAESAPGDAAQPSPDILVTDEQLQELTKADLEAAIEAENRKIEI
ncbi:MAG: AAA family ATPase [Firmicutes bacterium]|nr:AAA family ATPase [Bacillota bacterium]